MRDPHTRRIIARRWAATSPLLRAATTARAHLEADGRRLHAVHLHGRDIDEADTPYFVGFQWRYTSVIHRCLTDFGAADWLEAPHLTVQQPMFGLLITVLDRTALGGRPDGP